MGFGKKEWEGLKIIEKGNKKESWNEEDVERYFSLSVFSSLYRKSIGSCTRFYNEIPRKDRTIETLYKIGKYEYPKSITDEAEEELKSKLKDRIINFIYNLTCIPKERILECFFHPEDTTTEHTVKESLELSRNVLESINKDRVYVFRALDIYSNIKHKEIMESYNILQRIIKIDQKDEKDQREYKEITGKAIEKIFSEGPSLETLSEIVYQSLKNKPLEKIIGMKLDPI